MLGRRSWIPVLVAVALAVAGLAGTAMAEPSSEAGFLSKMNAERASSGLAAVQLDSSLTSYARTHSQFMADGGCGEGVNICHSTSAQLKTAAGSGWSKLGENVGRGGSVDSLHNAFMNSAGHAKNILDPEFNYVGIGTVHAHDRVYVTVVFMAKGSAPKPKPTTTTAPKPATTTTTVPPTTTTTLVVGPDKPVTPGESCFAVARQWWMCHD